MSSLVNSWVYWDYLQKHKWLETAEPPESPLGDIWLTIPWERRVQMKVHEDFLILITPSLPPWRKMSRLDSMKVSCRPSKLQCFKMALVMFTLEDTATLQNPQVFKELNYVFLHKYTSLEEWITVACLSLTQKHKGLKRRITFQYQDVVESFVCYQPQTC